MAYTKEQALELIEEAKQLMIQAANKSEEAKRASTETGILTATDIIQEGIQEASDQAFGQLPNVVGYVGTQTTQADVDAIGELTQRVEETAKVIGRTIGILVKVAARAALA